MSKYTTELRYICEIGAGLDESVGYNSLDTVLESARPHIFDFSYPIFDESYRQVLEKKILKHYYTREISEETVGLWKLRLNIKMNEIMPYYNKLYNSELIEFNPLYTVNLTRDKNTDFDSTRNGEENITDHTTTSNAKTYEEERANENDGTLSAQTSGTSSNTVVTDGETTTSGSSSSSSQNDTTTSATNSSTKYELYSDTPQGALTGVDTETYLTNAKKSTDNSESDGETHGTGSETVTTSGSGTNDETVTSNGTESGTRSDTSHNEGSENVSGSESANGSVGYTRSRGDSDVVNSTEDYLEHVVGYEGTTGSKALKEYRDTFLNIDMMVINELEGLFFQLW